MDERKNAMNKMKKMKNKIKKDAFKLNSLRTTSNHPLVNSISKINVIAKKNIKKFNTSSDVSPISPTIQKNIQIYKESLY